MFISNAFKRAGRYAAAAVLGASLFAPVTTASAQDQVAARANTPFPTPTIPANPTIGQLFADSVDPNERIYWITDKAAEYSALLTKDDSVPASQFRCMFMLFTKSDGTGATSGAWDFRITMGAINQKGGGGFSAERAIQAGVHGYFINECAPG